MWTWMIHTFCCCWSELYMVLTSHWLMWAWVTHTFCCCRMKRFLWWCLPVGLRSGEPWLPVSACLSLQSWGSGLPCVCPSLTDPRSVLDFFQHAQLVTIVGTEWKFLCSLHAEPKTLFFTLFRWCCSHPIAGTRLSFQKLYEDWRGRYLEYCSLIFKIKVFVLLILTISPHLLIFTCSPEYSRRRSLLRIFLGSKSLPCEFS